jgi:hypothetical protein
VNVISLLPAIGEASPGPEGCIMTLFGWDQVGGEQWYTPVFSSGTILVGQVPGGSFIESANPPVVDTKRLAWQLQGPASVTYTLFDTTLQDVHERRVFLAGAAAALAATLLVEAGKAILELLDGSAKEEGSAAEGRRLAMRYRGKPSTESSSQDRIAFVQRTMVIAAIAALATFVWRRSRKQCAITTCHDEDTSDRRKPEVGTT